MRIQFSTAGDYLGVSAGGGAAFSVAASLAAALAASLTSSRAASRSCSLTTSGRSSPSDVKGLRSITLKLLSSLFSLFSATGSSSGNLFVMGSLTCLPREAGGSGLGDEFRDISGARFQWVGKASPLKGRATGHYIRIRLQG